MTTSSPVSSQNIPLDLDSLNSVSDVHLVDAYAHDNEWQFPPMTDFEVEVLKEWSQEIPENANNFTLINLLKILQRHLQQAEGHSFNDKLNNLDFTASPYENVFGNLLLFAYLRILVKRDNENSVHLTEEEKQQKYSHVVNKLVETWNYFVDMYTPCSDDSLVPNSPSP